MVAKAPRHGDSDLGLTDLHMIVLASFARDEVNSVADVAKELGLSLKTVRDLVSDLETAGYIETPAIH